MQSNYTSKENAYKQEWAYDLVSNAEKNDKVVGTPKSAILFAVIALLTTFGLSIASNPKRCDKKYKIYREKIL